MKLYAVIYSSGDFSKNEQSTPQIAGVFQNLEIAEIVKQFSGLTAKIVSLELDKIPLGAFDFSQEVLGINLTEKVDNIKNGFKKMSEFDKECLMTAEEFLEDEESGCIISDDGSGYWATETMRSSISCFSVKPEWATHVCWYNK